RATRLRRPCGRCRPSSASGPRADCASYPPPSATLGPGALEVEALRRLQRGGRAARGGGLAAVARRARLDHHPDAAARVGGRGVPAVAALDGEEVGRALVGDLVAEDLVDQALALEPAHRSFFAQLEDLAPALVFERL